MSTHEPKSSVDYRLYRHVMGRFATGVTVVSTALEGRVHCMTANAFMSGSLEPQLCVISVALRARMHDILAQTRHFAVNVLSDEQEKTSRHFGGRPVEGFAPSFEFVGQTPLIAERIAAVGARVTAMHPCGDHSLFIGEIFHMSAGRQGKPLVFYGGHYAGLAHRPGGHHHPTPEFW